jgi:IS605 OrfB family transposase
MGKYMPITNWKDSKLIKTGKNWYLVLCHEIHVQDSKPTGGIVGVDFGVKRIMVATNSANKSDFFYHGGRLEHLRRGIRERRSEIQAVGTRSSRRLLQRLSRKENAVTGLLLHTASKALVNYAVQNDARIIVMENLKNIRDGSLRKGKNFRSKICRWPFAMGQFFVNYKAMAVGIETEFVSPKNTSRGCPMCGHVSASNRHGLQFKCEKCGHRDDSDRNGSVNIRLRSVSVKHNSIGTGSVNPLESSEPLEIGNDVVEHSTTPALV